MTAAPDPMRLTRLPERQVFDRSVLHAILDAAAIAHVGLSRAGRPVVLPMGCARDGESLLLHGSTGGGLLRDAAAGAPIAATVTHLDGLVFATSLFESSMNYRSAMVVGVATVVDGEAKLRALRTLSEHLMPGRWAEVRAPSRRELAATLVLRLPLDQTSVKVREGSPGEHPEDRDPGAWAGVLPLALVTGQPVPDPDFPSSAPHPESVRLAAARWTTRA